MVKVTEKYIFQKLSRKPQIQPRKKGETDHEYLNRVTHLYLQSQFVDQIAPMTDCESVSVIYLQNNQLQSIHNMENFPNLSYLYLQNNQLTKIENLNCLKHLKKLYLGSNEISVVEGLDELGNLVELHIESQRLPKGETLYFDPRTIKNLGKSLKVLNVADNNMTSIQGLSGLSKLEELIANDNRISDVDEVVDTLSGLPRLVKLKLTGNPIAENRKYREGIALASSSIKQLDDKEITPEFRTFVERLALSKESRAQGGSRSVPHSSYDFGPPKERTPPTGSGSKLYPLLKFLRMPRTVSTFSANVSPHYFHQSIRAFQYGFPNFKPSLNFK